MVGGTGVRSSLNRESEVVAGVKVVPRDKVWRQRRRIIRLEEIGRRRRGHRRLLKGIRQGRRLVKGRAVSDVISEYLNIDLLILDRGEN